METGIEDIRALFLRFYRPLCLYALHYLKDADAAEDMVQDCFATLLERGMAADSPRSYLYAMVRNRSIDRLRSQGLQEALIRPEDLEGEIPDEEAIRRSGIEARLWEAVGRLPRGRRELLLMSKRDGMSYEQIAAEKGLSVNTVRNQISRALRSLREDADRILDFLLLFFTVPAI